MAARDDLRKHANDRIKLNQQSIDALNVVANGRLPDDPERAEIDAHIKRLQSNIEGDNALIGHLDRGLAG